MITTKRLFLIPWHASDADELYELAKDLEIGPLCGWEPHKTLEDSKQVLAKVLSEKFCYAVKDMKTGHVIGSMSLKFEEIPDSKDSSKQLYQAEIGYWIGRPYWGQGLAPEGAQALTAYAFEEHGVDQVIIRYLERNKKSASVARKCGLTEVGIITDFNKYTGKEEQFGISVLTKADWERAQK